MSVPARGFARIVLCSGIALFSGIARAQDDVERLIAELGDERDSTVRYAAYRALSRTRPPGALPLLVRALPGWGPNSQSLGITLLRGYPRERSEPAFGRLLKADAPFLRLCAAVALFRFGDRARAREIAGALADDDVSSQLRVRMLGQLYGVRDPHIQAAVRELLVADIANAELGQVLAHLLSTEDPYGRAAVEALSKRAELDRDRRAACAAFCLATGGQDAAIELADLLDAEPPPSIAQLQRFLLAAPRLGDELERALVRALERAPDLSRVRSVALVLARHDARGAVPALRRLLDDDDPRIVEAAFEALADIPGALEPSALERMLRSDAPELCLSAADLMRRRDDLSGLARVIEIAGRPGKHRAEAVRVLGGFRARAAVEPLIDALTDADRIVRQNGMTGLESVLRGLLPYRRIDLTTTGYAPEAPDAARAEAAERIRAWWRAAVAR